MTFDPDCYEDRHARELEELADAALEAQIADYMDREHARRRGLPMPDPVPPIETYEVEASHG